MARGWNAITMFTLAALALPTGLLAQGGKGATIDTLMQTPRYQADIARLFATLPADVFQRCPALVSSGSQVTVIQPLRFAANGQPVAGAWKQSFPVSGCGNDTTINFYFTAQPDQHIASMVAMPGDTHADPVLQGDAARGLIGAVRGKVPACQDPHVRNTRFEGMLAKGPARPGAWRETWTVSACGQAFAVPLNFIPELSGTRIEAGAAPAP